MRVTAVRSHGAKDRFYVVRDDATTERWAFPSYGAILPHDLCHLVVEAAFGLRAGFWGGLARGEARADLAEAEALASLPWTDRTLDLDAVWNEHRRRLALPPAPPLAPATVEAVRREIDALTARWAALPDRGALAFDVDSETLAYRLAP